MHNLPYEHIVSTLVEHSGESQEAIEEKIKQKMDQLSGLISQEGAAHIVANELNVSLVQESGSKVTIQHLLPGVRNVEVVGKVLQTYELREFQVSGRSGKVANFLMGDETGVIRVALWGGLAEQINDMKAGDVVKLTSGYVRDNSGRKELHANDRSELTLNPEGITIEVPQQKSITRKKLEALQEEDTHVEVLGTLVELYEPRFFEVCGQCGKRVKEEKCAEHQEAQLDYSYVLNGVLDDGTDTIRTVFFRNHLHSLLNLDHDGLLQLRQAPEGFQQHKQSLLGHIVKLSGKVNKNEMFDRKEFVVNGMDLQPDPREELT